MPAAGRAALAGVAGGGGCGRGRLRAASAATFARLPGLIDIAELEGALRAWAVAQAWADNKPAGADGQAGAAEGAGADRAAARRHRPTKAEAPRETDADGGVRLAPEHPAIDPAVRVDASHTPAQRAAGIDGKECRGARRSDQPKVHLLGVVDHRTRMLLAQRWVTDKTSEVTRFHDILAPLPLAGVVLTVNAMTPADQPQHPAILRNPWPNTRTPPKSAQYFSDAPPNSEWSCVGAHRVSLDPRVNDRTKLTTFPSGAPCRPRLHRLRKAHHVVSTAGDLRINFADQPAGNDAPARLDGGSPDTRRYDRRFYMTTAPDAGSNCTQLRDRYLDLLRETLTFSLWDGGDGGIWEPRPSVSLAADLITRRRKLEVIRSSDAAIRAEGLDWPRLAHTMIGSARLKNLQECVEAVLRDRVPGDLIETGVWRGGACILMRGVLAAHGVSDRTVWLADSFAGLPAPDAARYSADAGDRHFTRRALAVSLSEVRDNFRRYGLLDEQVRFLEGWFRDTLPTAPIAKLAVLRLDGDMYESTIQALESLYPRLSSGGFCIVDDYGAIEGCRAAVEDYRTREDITESLVKIDKTGVYWRRATQAASR